MTGKRKQPASVARHVADVVILAATVAAAWFLWPAFLGGSSRMITVQGHSMEPTYATGDLVLLDTGAEPEVGKIVVFQIPDDELGGGQLVVHRVIGRRDDGTYITQGDNSENADTFMITRSDILGSPRLVVPHGGTAIGVLSSPVGLGAATGGLCTMLLWPRKRGELDESVEATTNESGDASVDVWSAVNAYVAVAPQVDEVDFVAEAEAWLREQLALIGRPID